jgi:hypothetical protein
MLGAGGGATTGGGAAAAGALGTGGGAAGVGAPGVLAVGEGGGFGAVGRGRLGGAGGMLPFDGTAALASEMCPGGCSPVAVQRRGGGEDG